MGGGTLILGEGGPCRIWRSGGFPNFPGKSSPSSPSHLLFFPAPLSSNSSTPQNPPYNSLDQAFSPFLSPLPNFFSLRPFLKPSSLFLVLYRILSETLRNPSLGPPKGPKGPKRPFLGLFRGFPPKNPKRAKIPLFRPFLTPFSPLPYPL